MLKNTFFKIISSESQRQKLNSSTDKDQIYQLFCKNGYDKSFEEFEQEMSDFVNSEDGKNLLNGDFGELSEEMLEMVAGGFSLKHAAVVGIASILTAFSVGQVGATVLSQTNPALQGTSNNISISALADQETLDAHNDIIEEAKVDDVSNVQTNEQSTNQEGDQTKTQAQNQNNQQNIKLENKKEDKKEGNNQEDIEKEKKEEKEKIERLEKEEQEKKEKKEREEQERLEKEEKKEEKEKKEIKEDKKEDIKENKEANLENKKKKITRQVTIENKQVDVTATVGRYLKDKNCYVLKFSGNGLVDGFTEEIKGIQSSEAEKVFYVKADADDVHAMFKNDSNATNKIFKKFVKEYTDSRNKSLVNNNGGNESGKKDIKENKNIQAEGENQEKDKKEEQQENKQQNIKVENKKEDKKQDKKENKKEEKKENKEDKKEDKKQENKEDKKN